MNKQEEQKTITQEEIVSEIKRLEKDDPFGFKRGDLLRYLDFDHAKPYLGKWVTDEDWEFPLPKDRESILKEMENYMTFAWDKATSHRGLSAGRSMAHYTAWIWMINDQDRFGNLENYDDYGIENLKLISDTYGFET